MSEMEQKLGAILNNPQMMQQIMSMAQAFGNQQAPPPPQENPPPADEEPHIDMHLLKKITGLAQHSGIDKREQALLGALNAYLSRERITKLEKAMRAAKIAKLASSALGGGGLQALLGR